MANIRRALAQARHLPPAPQVALPEFVPEGDPRALAGQFAAELEALGGMCERVPASRAANRVVELAQARGAGALLGWDGAHLPVPGLWEALRMAGIERVSGEVPAGEPERSRALAAVERVTVGLTGAEAGLADTGTLVLRSGPGRPRLASLSVRTHMALLLETRLCASWAAWQAQQGPGEAALGGASNLTLISGPSRTGDIEMTLTVGVHGPAELIVLLICEDGAA